jgi:hypothetical protein
VVLVRTASITVIERSCWNGFSTPYQSSAAAPTDSARVGNRVIQKPPSKKP